jgi:biotin-dependent carboxylase-like uncharacterized protein
VTRPPSSPQAARSALSPSEPTVVEVVRAGALTTVQDSGRRGLAHLGVPRSGALDRAAHGLANRLVGNEEGAPVLESTLDGVALRFHGPAVVAVTGAYAKVHVDGRPAGWGLPVRLGPGSVVDVGAAEAGARCCVAVAGGFDVARTLGSCSTDVFSGLGPPPLVAGQRLALKAPAGRVPALDVAPYPLPAAQLALPLHPGPRRSWLTERGERDLFAQTYRVSADSNRVALRLAGDPLERHARPELPSEGIVWGSVQLLGTGEILVFLADHPTTGGYPVVAVVDAGAASACAQARPGDPVTFRRAAARGLSGW